MLMSAYLWTGEHLSVRNLSILDAIGELTKHQGLNWLLEMDAQLTPEELSATGWLADVGGTIIRTKRSTCRGMGGGREIDFFVADKAIAHCFAEATLVEDAAVAPHTPIKTKLVERVRQRHAWRRWRPKNLPLLRTVGCALPPPSWPLVPQDKKLDAGELEQVWRRMSRCAEEEIQELLGQTEEERTACSGRGDEMRQVYVPVAGPICNGRVKGNAASRAWRWTAARLSELIYLAQATRRHGLDRMLNERASLNRKWHGGMHVLEGIGSEKNGLLEFLSCVRSWDLTRDDAGEQCRVVFILMQVCNDRALSVEREQAANRAKVWRLSLKEKSRGGAGFIHRLTKWRAGPAPSRASVVQELRGITGMELLDGQTLVDEEARKLDEIWMSHGVESILPTDRPWENQVFDEPLVRLDTMRFDQICCSFPVKTGIGVDCWHPRVWTWLSDEGKQTFVDLIHYISRFIQWPSQVRVVLYFLIAKPDGGLRGIGLLSSLVRTVERAHAVIFAEWEAAHAKPYDWASRGGGAEDAMWEQMLVDESLRDDEVTATAVLDQEKAFEHISATQLWVCGRQQSMPMQLVCLMISIFSAKRVVTADGVVAQKTTATFSAAVPGSVGGTRALKVVAYCIIDPLVARWPSMNFKLFVDDLSMQRVGRTHEVKTELRGAVECYIHESELRGIPVSRRRQADEAYGKGFLVASNKELKQDCACWAESLGIELRSESTQLGVDSAAGRVIKREKQLKRFCKARCRVGKVKSLSKQGARTSAVAKRGLTPAMSYGAMCVGVPPTLTNLARTSVSAALGGSAVGKDRTLRLWLNDADPLMDFTLKPIHKWARAAWDDDSCKTRMTRVWRRALSRGANKNPWKCIRGPGSALWATLSRLGWKWPAPFTFLTANGSRLDLVKTAPCTVREEAKSDLETQELRKWAAARKLPGIQSPWLEPIRAELQKQRRMKNAGQRCGAIQAFVGGDFGTQEKLWIRGQSEKKLCQHKDCGTEVGTQHHRFWRCRGSTEERKKVADSHPKVAHRGESSSTDSPLFSRGIVNSPFRHSECDVQPFEQKSINGMETQLFTGQVYTDGSGKGVGKLKGYGWSVVATDENGEPLFGKFGSVPGERRRLSSLRCELFALLQAVSEAAPPLRVGIDNSTVVKGMLRGRRLCVAGCRPHCDLWLQIWNVVDDVFPEMQGLEVHKVKAHQKKSDGKKLVGPAARDFKGNELADVYAKEGAVLHGPPKWKADHFKQSWSDAQEVLAYVADLAEAVGSFADTSRRVPGARKARRTGRRRREAPPGDSYMHSVVVKHDRLSCEHCGLSAFSKKARRDFHYQACKGVPTVVRRRINGKQPPRDASEHELWRTGDYTWCNRCGGFASKKMYKLGEKCGGVPASAAASQRREKLRRGRKPLNASAFIGMPERLCRAEKVAFTSAVARQFSG